MGPRKLQVIAVFYGGSIQEMEGKGFAKLNKIVLENPLQTVCSWRPISMEMQS